MLLLPTTLLLFLRTASATFSLNSTGPYWTYTASSLAPTTAQKCLTAYSAPIACPMTLVGLVTSLRPGFQPTQDDLSRLCTSGCKSALEDYVQNVGSNCQGKGDLAVQRRVKNGMNDTYARVWMVGQMFEYTYAQACAKDQTNNFCPLTSTTLPPTPANCTSPCSISFYTNAHSFIPASQKQFLQSFLTTQTAYWIRQFNLGYKNLVACGAVVGNSAVPALIASTAGGFVQPTGVSSSGGYGLDEDVATATITTGMGLVGTGTGTSGVSATTGATATATVVQEGKNGGSVVGGELKRVVVLGCLGVVAAAAFVVI